MFSEAQLSLFLFIFSSHVVIALRVRHGRGSYLAEKKKIRTNATPSELVEVEARVAEGTNVGRTTPLAVGDGTDCGGRGWMGCCVVWINGMWYSVLYGCVKCVESGVGLNE